jgi:Family of unknown function (DUF6020)
MSKSYNCHPWKGIFLYSIPMILIWIIYLIAYYPAVMSIDSLSQWNQMTTGSYWDGHPVIHTLFNKLITSIYYSPAAIVLSQIVITALIIGFGLYSFEKIGVKKVYLYLIILFFMFVPTFGFMVIILWKDILFSSFLLLYTIIIINVVYTKGDYLIPMKNKAFIIIISVVVCLFRHNGLMVFIGTSIMLLIYFKTKFKDNLIIIALTSIIFLVVKGPFYNYLNVSETSSNEALAIPTQQIAYVIKENGSLSDSEADYFNSILPLEEWKKSYNKFSVDPIKMHSDFKKEIITNDMGTFLKNWISVLRKNPSLCYEAYKNQTNIIWNYNSIVNIAHMRITENELGLKNIIVNNKISHSIKSLFKVTTETKLAWILWKPAIYMYFSILFIIITALKYGKSATIILAPMLLNIFTYLLAIPAPDFRYLYSNLLIFPFIFLTTLTKKPRTKNLKFHSYE